MNIFTDRQLTILKKNGLPGEHGKDHIPCAYLIQPELKYQWLITELFDDMPDVAYGMYQTDDVPKVGFIDLKLIRDLRSSETKIFNSIGFSTKYRLSVFKAVADDMGKFVPGEDGFEEIFEAVRKRHDLLP